MHSHEQRVALVQQRLAQRRLRRRCQVAGGLSAGCICLAMALCLWLPREMEQAIGTGYGQVLGAASVFAAGRYAGYILVGAVCLGLGICAGALGLYAWQLYRGGHGRG